MSGTPRVAVVGAGYWGKNLVRNFAALGGLAAVCDSDPAALARAGDTYPGIGLHRDYLELLADPDIVCEGLPRMVDDQDTFEDVLYDAGVAAYENIPKKKRRDEGRIEQAVERALRAEARELWGKKPIVNVFVQKV